jgi:hypothetical protein
MADDAEQPDAPQPPPDPSGAQPDASGEPQGEQPSQEELRARLEEQLRKVRVQDVLLESVASILNLSARRIAKEDERDLEQARIGIEAVRAVTELLEPEPREQVRNALSELQMLYAREAGGGGAGPEGQAPAGGPAPAGAEGAQPKRDSGLWTPPGSA